MPVDPSIFELANRPTVALLNPQEVQARQIQIRNALAQGRLQDQEIQSRQLTMDSQAAAQKAMVDWNAPSVAPPAAAPGAAPPSAAPGGIDPQTGIDPLTGTALPAPPGVPGGAPPMPAGAPAPPASAPQPAAAAPVPRPKVPTVKQLMDRGVRYDMASTMVENFQKVEKGSAEIDKERALASEANSRTNTLVQAQISDIASAVLHAGANPEVTDWHFQQFASANPELAQKANAIRTQLAGMAPAQQKTFLEGLVQTPATIEARTKEKTAAVDIRGKDQTYDENALKNGSALLSSTPDQKAYATAFNQMKPELQQHFPSPDQWTPATSAQVAKIGQTSQEQITTAATAARDKQTATNENAHLSIERAKLSIEQAKAKGTADPLASLTPSERIVAQSVSQGDMSFATLGRMKNKENILAGAFTMNGALTAETFNTKDSFTNPEKTQAKNLGTISRIVGHIGRFEANSPSMGFAPAYAAGVNVSGGQNALNVDAHAISGELEKLTSGGVGSVEQVKEWQKSLHSPSASARQKAVDEISKVIGSQYEGMNQTYKAAFGKDIPLDKYVSKAGQEWMKSKGIQVGGETTTAATPKAGDKISVTDPSGGVHVFPSEAAAADFKTKAGIH